MDTLPLVVPQSGVIAFDYAAMTADVANEARAAVERYRGRSKSYMMDTGRDLLAVKERLEHGLFLRWVEAEMGLTPRTAQNFMQAAERFADKSEIVSHLPPTAIYQLSAPSTPEPVRAEVVRRLEAGERLDGSAVVGMVQAAKVDARKKDAQAREASRRAALTDEQREYEDALAAKGEKRQAALARKQERDRQETIRERHLNEAEADIGASFLLERLSADEIAVFFARFDYTQRNRVFNRALERAHVERASRNEPFDMPVGNFAASNRHGFAWISPEEQAHARDLASRYEAGEPIEPVTIVDEGNGRGITRYEIVDGSVRYHALSGVLHRETIPTRMAPRVNDSEFAVFGGRDAKGD